MDAATRRLSLVAILAACTAFAIGMGLTLPLLSILLERRGYPGSINGLNLATAGVAAIVSTFQIPRLLRTFGTARYLAGSLLLTAVALLALYAVPNIWLWFPVRFVLSVGLNGLFVATEFWINQLAEEKSRGRYIAFYGMATAGGYGLGPAILWFTGTHGIAPFLCGAGLMLLATVPVLLARRAAPVLDPEPGPSPLWALRTAPGILSAALVFGAIDAGLAGLFPVYALRSGYSDTDAALAITAFSGGSLLFQYPLGMLADRFDRRLLLIACAGVGVAGAVVVPFLTATPALMYFALFLWGGIVLGIYTIGLTLVGERFKGSQLASANAAYVMLYAVGLLAGPPVEGTAMDLWNPHGLMLVLGLISMVYAVALATRRPMAATASAG